MHIKPDDYRVNEGTKVDLKKWPTAARPVYRSDRQYRDLLRAHVQELSAQQAKLLRRIKALFLRALILLTSCRVPVNITGPRC